MGSPDRLPSPGPVRLPSPGPVGAVAAAGDVAEPAARGQRVLSAPAVGGRHRPPAAPPAEASSPARKRRKVTAGVSQGLLNEAHDSGYVSVR